MCIAGAIIGGAALSAGSSLIGSSEQASAAGNAQQIAQNEFNTTTAQEQPYLNAGNNAESQLSYLLGTGNKGGSSSAGGFGSLNTPFNASTFKSLSPQYNFDLQQGAQGTLNQDSSAQGAESGAALKDLMSYNQNYANNSFNSAFANYQTQQNNVFNRLSSVASLGQNAAGNLGNTGAQLAGSAAQSATNVGTALGGGIASAGSSLGNAGTLYGLLNSLKTTSSPDDDWAW